MFRQTIRHLSTSATRNFASVTKPLVNETSTAPAGSFKTFAEYRQFIVKKDPETLKARFKIMVSDSSRNAKCPDSEAELKSFGKESKKVAYNK